MSILTGPEIWKQYEAGEIIINPFDGRRIQPNSLDVTLGKEVCVYREVTYDHSEPLIDRSSFDKSRALTAYDSYLDAKRDNPVRRYEMDESGWLVRPGILYLMHVNEVLWASKYVMTLDGKSSYARLGLIVHFTAGHAETGFHGQYTMEVSALHPVRIYPGMSIAQVIFTTVEGEVEDYKQRGNYVGETAMGAQPSRSWRSFQ